MYSQIMCATPGVKKGATSCWGGLLWVFDTQLAQSQDGFHDVADGADVLETSFDNDVAASVRDPSRVKLVARVLG